MSTYKNDRPEHLDIALRSIYSDQVEKPDQIVLVKDGPLSSSLNAVVDKWKDKIGGQFKVVSRERNQGLASSLNHGLRYCESEFIARMDSDDIALPERFKLQKKFLKTYPQIDILGGAIEEFDSNGNVYKRHFPKNNDKIINEIPKGTPFAHPTVVIKKEVLQKHKYAGEMTSSDGKIVVGNEDIDLWFRLLNVGYKGANLNEIVLRYRKNESFYDRRAKSKAWSELKIYFKGTYRLHGISYLLIFPFLRFITRIMPKSLIKAFYNQRKLIFNRHQSNNR